MDEKEKIWLDFISKLNDRYINRRTATGISIWALIGVEVIILFNLIDSLPEIFRYKEVSIKTAVLLLILNNFFLGLFIIISNLNRFYNIQQGRYIATKTETYGKSFIKAFIYFTVLIIIISNILMFIFNKELNTLPYVFLAIFLLSDILKLTYKKFRQRTKMQNLLISNSSMFVIFDDKKIFNAILDGLLLLTFSIWAFYDFSKLYSIVNNIFSIKIALQVQAFWAVLIYAMHLYFESLKFQWLENLERQILMDDLKVDFIKNEFIKNFVGESVQKWLKEIENDIIGRKEEYRKSISSIDGKISILLSIEDITISFNGCLECSDCIIDKEIENQEQLINLVDEKIQLTKEIQDFIDSVLEKINLYLSNPNINQEEVLYLSPIRNELKETMKSYSEKLCNLNEDNQNMMLRSKQVSELLNYID